MIRGSVNPDGEAEVRLLIRGADKAEEIRFVVDTGFNGFLTVPVERIMALNLIFSSQVKATLANGETEAFDAYRGAVRWEDQWHPVLVLRAEGDALAGMGLLRGKRLTMDVIDGGSVTVEPLANP